MQTSSWLKSSGALAAAAGLLAALALLASVVPLLRDELPGSPLYFVFGPIAAAITALLWATWATALLALRWAQVPPMHRTIFIGSAASSALLLAFSWSKV